MTMPKFEPVAWGGTSGVGEWVVSPKQIWKFLTTPLHTPDQLTEAYEAGKREASEDIEQTAFEKWLYDKCPSGDVESVQRQWLKSYEYAEFAEKLEQAAQIEQMRQQLAAALAACKLKDEALSDMRSGWRYIRETYGDLYGVGWERAENKSDAALAAQPDDSALIAWIGEPVARTLKRVGKEQYQPGFGIVARTYAELPKGAYPDTWEELDELYSPPSPK